jgi:hypothetical protein
MEGRTDYIAGNNGEGLLIVTLVLILHQSDFDMSSQVSIEWGTYSHLSRST